MRCTLISLVSLFVVFSCFGMYQEGTANQATGPITVDGVLSEADYNSNNLVCNLDPTRNDIIPPYIGQIDDPNDQSLKGYLLWDDNYLYIGVDFTDNINETPTSQGVIDVWADDIIELWVTKSYDDAFQDFSDPLYGSFGHQFMIAMNNVMDEPLWHGSDAVRDEGVPRAQLLADGFEYKWTNVSGANFNAEFKIAWNGTFLPDVVPASGTEIGFCIGSADADGAGWEGSLRWTGDTPHLVPDCWGKVTLAGGSKIRPHFSATTENSIVKDQVLHVYNAFGRRMDLGNHTHSTGLRIYVTKEGGYTKSILLR